MKKTNRELNQAHDQRMQDRVRPAPKEWKFEELEKALHEMIRRSQNEQA